MAETVEANSNTMVAGHEVEAVSVPPRYWWLKRILAGSGLLLVGLVLLRLWWGWYADRLLQAEIDRIVAAGEPIYPEDFDPKESVPDDQNAAKFLLDAEKSLNLTTDQSTFVSNHCNHPEVIFSRRDEVQRILSANAGVLTLVKQAASLPDADWGLRMRSPAIQTSIPSLGGQRNLSKFLAMAGSHFAQMGKHAEAIELWVAMVAQADSTSSQPTLIANLVGIAISALQCAGMEPTIPKLAVEDERDGDHHDGSATREQIEKLIDLLVNSKRPRENMHRAMLRERMVIIDIFRDLVDGRTRPILWVFGGIGGPSPWYERIASWPFVPLRSLNARWAIRTQTRFIVAAKEPTFVKAQLVLPDLVEENRTALERFMRPMGWEIFKSLQRSFVLYYRGLAMRRMTGVALAIRLYELDHGHRPERLDELVPEYLDDVPLDPFGDGAQVIGYLPHASPPVLFSINDDGVDDGGRYGLHHGGGVDVNILDLVYFLDGDRPMPDVDANAGQPSGSNADDDAGNAEDDGGKDDKAQ